MSYTIPQALMLTAMILPIYIIIRLIFLKVKKIKFNAPREVGMLAFFLVMSFVLVMTVVPMIRIDVNKHISIYNPGDWHRINLVPFKFIDDLKEQFSYGDYFYAIFNLLGNIVLFAAISFLAAILWTFFRKLKNVAICGLLMTVGIEAIQYPIGRGTDIDDIIFNMLGFLLGFALYKLAVKIFHKHKAENN